VVTHAHQANIAALLSVDTWWSLSSAITPSAIRGPSKA
jgi:hypothetical protein